MSGEFAAVGTGYPHKLRLGGRPAALIVAFMLLLDAVRRRVGPEGVSAFALTAAPEVAAATTALAVQVARYVEREMGVELGSVTVIASALQGAILQSLLNAAAKLEGEALAARIELIVIAETQRLTMTLTRQAAAIALATRITRTAQPTACATCQALAGTYAPPFPADLWTTHPHCTCAWRIGA